MGLPEYVAERRRKALGRRCAAGTSMRRILVQPGRNAFPDMALHIVEHFGFELVQLTDYDIHLPQSKWTHLRGLARQSLDLVELLPRLKNCEFIIAIGPISYLIKLMRRLRLISYRQSLCIGWHIRSPRWFLLFRLLSRLDRRDDRYIVFSESEIELYRVRLVIARERMYCLAYGEWRAPAASADAGAIQGTEQGYYFAGGYSNRDYKSLIAAFRTIGAPLVIVCSALNNEFDGRDLPINVKVLRDLPSESFEALLRRAKACIVPLKYDTGASGQSVVVRAMRNGKLVIASDFGSVRGYIVDGVSGYLVKDMARELPELVAKVERDPGQAERLGRAAHQRYREWFSPAAEAAALSRILSPLLARP